MTTELIPWKVVRHLVLAALLGTACGGESTKTERPTESSCLPPSRVVGESCIEPGVQDNGCPAATLFVEADGSCRPAGMIADDCAEGFEFVPFDEQIEGASMEGGSCEPILPTEPCPDGLMAVPGDTACHPVMDCGAGKWGDIVADATTQFVDQSYAGVSDGTAAAPWTSIGQAVTAAAPDALVAIAAGSYINNFVIDKSLRLQGVCPAQVELVASSADFAALVIADGASGTEVRGLSIRGGAIGVALTGSKQVLLEQLHIHDNASAGVAVLDDLGPPSCTLRASLLERNHDLGVYVQGAEAIVEASVVRDTLPQMRGVAGRGINIQPSTISGDPSLAIVRGSLVERNHDVGVFVGASEASVEASVVRDTLPNEQELSGRGISIELASSLVTVRASLMERNQVNGVSATGSEVTIEASVVRDTLPDLQGMFGRGISIQRNSASGAASIANVLASLVERNHTTGVYISGSEATVEGCVVRDTLPNAQGSVGRGINIQQNVQDDYASFAIVRASLVERNKEVGVFIGGADVSVDGCRIDSTAASDVGLFGDGLIAAFEGTPTSLSLDASFIDDSVRAGVSSFGATVSIGTSAIRCAAIALDGEAFNGESHDFDDRGGNACGCPDADAICKLVSTGLLPPQAQAPSE
jgi:hypothetical protein